MAFKPLLSASADVSKDPDVFSKLRWPLLGSPKLDGIRVMPRGGVLKSRKLLDIPNAHAQQRFGHLEHLDGEIIVGNASDFDVYNRTQSVVMSQSKEADMTFYVFDWARESDADMPYMQRLQKLYEVCEDLPNVVVVDQTRIENLDEMLSYEESILAAGYEGIMLREPQASYKHGRSTFKEQTLIKLKRFQDDEADVIGFIEANTNTNEAQTDELGHTKRSTAKEGMVGAGTLGKFVVTFNGLTLEIPPGVLKHTERKAIWECQDQYLGRTLKFRHFPHGSKDRPRLPRFVGWRTAEDM